jgi:hypothetical protein
MTAEINKTQYAGTDSWKFVTALSKRITGRDPSGLTGPISLTDEGPRDSHEGGV